MDKSPDLIIYSYHETEEAATNFAFFRKHALHAKADFIIMINGEHTLNLTSLHALPNVRIVERENRCFDLGGYKETLEANMTLVNAYKRFMFINASLRGPFLPPWAGKTCWSDAYWDKLDARTKIVGKFKYVMTQKKKDFPHFFFLNALLQPSILLSPSLTACVYTIGMTWNCANGHDDFPPHVQSMIFAFDRETLQKLLLPHLKCYENMWSAVHEGEVQITPVILAAGYDAFAMEGRFASHAGSTRKNTTAFLEWCVDDGRGLLLFISFHSFFPFFFLLSRRHG